MRDPGGEAIASHYMWAHRRMLYTTEERAREKEERDIKEIRIGARTL